MKLTAKLIADQISIDCEILSSQFPEDMLVTHVSTAASASAGSVFFLKSAKHVQGIPDLVEALAIVSADVAPLIDGPMIVVKNPRLAFGRIVDVFFTSQRTAGGIHDRATVEDGADIHSTAYVGPGAVVESGSRIGPRSRIEANAVIHANVEIGSDCVIGANTVIGGKGFGVEELDNYERYALPHVGGVRIGDNVVIGNCTAIDGGMLEPTVIEDHVHIDNLVHVAHNAVIGKGSFLIAGCEISGRVKLGNGVWIGPNACTLQGVELGDDCLVGLGSVVRKSSEEGWIIAGNPAKPLRKR